MLLKPQEFSFGPPTWLLASAPPGIPLVVIETKTRIQSRIIWMNAASEIHTVYELGWPEFFVPNALSVTTDGKELHYGGVAPTSQTGVSGDPPPRTSSRSAGHG